MSCKYQYKGKEYEYSKMLDYIINHFGDFLEESDIVYSKEGSQKETVERLRNLKKENLEYLADKNFLINGEPTINESGTISVTHMIDDDRFQYQGSPCVPKIKPEALIQEIAESYGKSVPPQEALAMARHQVEVQYKTIADYGLVLHKGLDRYYYGTTPESLQSTFREVQGENVISPEISNVLYKGMSEYLQRYLEKAHGKDCKIINNIALRSKLKGFSEELIAHIDFIVIDRDAKLHIYLLKASTLEDIKGEKLNKYRMQLAFIKQMFRNNKYNVKGATLNIIPIKMDFNEDYTKLTGARLLGVRCLSHDGTKYKLKYQDLVAQYFIPAASTIKPIQADWASKDILNSEVSAIFPSLEIEETGEVASIDNWIKNNYNSRAGSRIKQITDPEYHYEVIIGDEVIKIKEATEPINNKEMRQQIRDHMDFLTEEGYAEAIDSLATNIETFHKNSKDNFVLDKKYGRAGNYIARALQPYMGVHQDGKTKSGKPKYVKDWELINDDLLRSYGILLFQHYHTKQIDVVVLSQYDVNIEYKFRGFRNIGGNYVSDMGSSELLRYRANYGNIRMVQAMVILNKFINSIEGEYSMGAIKVLSLYGNGRIRDFKSFQEKCFNPLIKVVKKNNPDFKFENNFNNIKGADPIEVMFRLYQDIVTTHYEASRTNTLTEMGFDKLVNPDKEVEDRAILKDILKAMEENFKFLKGDPEIVKYYLGRPKEEPYRHKIAQLYYAVQRAYLHTMGFEIDPELRSYNLLQRNAFTSKRNPDRNVRIFVNVVRTATNTAAQKTVDAYEPLYNIFQDYYEACGYSNIRNMTVGDVNNKVFKKFYKEDSQGNMVMEFKNPYTEIDDETDAEFLKKVLFYITKVRCSQRGIPFSSTKDGNEFTINDINSVGYKRFVSKFDWFLNVPLIRATAASRRQHYGYFLKENLQKAYGIIKDAKKYMREQVYETIGEEYNDRNREAESLLDVRNPFSYGEGKDNRTEMLNEYGVNYFEQNIEMLAAQFIDRDIRTKELNEALIVGRAVELELLMLGEDSNLTKVAQESIKELHDYAKTSVYNVSIMDETMQKITTKVLPLRRRVTAAFLMGNIVSAFRDTFEGIWQNFARTINHYQTDIKAKEVMEGYKEVVFNMLTSTRSINKISQLCKIYTLSNFDKADIAKSIVTSRSGICNWENWAYSTLRRPDFLNRMVLFVAQCIHDGTWEAFDMDGIKVKYDWRKDKRFSALASGDKNSKDYQKQLGLYYRCIRNYNKEHPNKPLKYTDDLPLPYSMNEVEQFKNLSDSIYGAYDRSTKAKWEYTSVGFFFGMFATWFNGAVDNYFADPDIYENGLHELVQDEDEDGNKLYLDKDGLQLKGYENEDGTITYKYLDGTEYKGDPPAIDMKGVPLPVQGIWHLCGEIKNLFKYELIKSGDFKAFKNRFMDEIYRNTTNKPLMWKGLSDAMLLALFLFLFKMIFGPSHDEFVKEVKKNPTAYNPALVLFENIIFKGGSRSYDGFKGGWNAIEYLGEDTDPPIYNFPIKLTADVFKTVFGDKTVGDVLTGNLGVFRAFQTVNKVYWKEDKNTIS